MPPLAEEDMSVQQRDALAEFKRVRGYDARGPFIVLSRQPELLRRVRPIGDYLRLESPLPAAIRELVILVTAHRWSQEYEWRAHVAIAIQSGITCVTIDSLAAGCRPPGLDRAQGVAFDFGGELLDTGQVSDRVYEAARAEFGEAGIVELTVLIGYYTLLAMTLNVARTPASENVQSACPSAITGAKLGPACLDDRPFPGRDVLDDPTANDRDHRSSDSS
ncbi:MAG: carboxymuconolactone decarboxylase family protein [Cyanobacteria bacterium]|nr:carboxymuconolactone decarboxylase family protein [Cyanobacteriota bacterium]